MIIRPRVLRPDETPDRELIVHRGDSIQDVREQFRRLTTGQADSPFVIHGPPGTGKTMIARRTLDDELDDTATAYCDCWEHYTEQNILAEVAKKLGVMAAKHDSTPTSRIVEALLEEPDGERLVVLDELELVHEPDPLETLAAAPNLAVVGIVNEPDEVADLLSTTYGGIDRAQMLRFREYSRRAVRSIISTRAEHGLLEGSLRRRQCREIARRARGDARLGIATLQAAAQCCEYGGRISDDDVESGYQQAQRQLHEANVDRLTEHQQIVYEVLQDIGPATPSDIQRKYRRRVDEPRSRTTLSTYLKKMTWYGLVESVGRTRGRKYRIDTSGYVSPDAA